ncbi:MAG: hypothetical protein WBA75_06165 [Sphingopyxis granuli]
MAEALGQALLYLRTDDQGLDAGINNAKGKSEGLGRTFDQTSGKADGLGKAMDRTGASAKRFGAEQAKVTAVSGAQRAGMQQLSMQLNDVATMYSLGARPMQIFSSQIGQITQAVQLASGGTSRFAAIMGSPWTMAVTTAAVVLVPLIGNLLGTDDAATKAKGSTLDFADVLDYRRMSITAFRDAIEQLNKSTERLIDLQAISTDRLRANAQAQVTEAKRRIADIDRELAKLGDAPTGLLSLIPGFGETGTTAARRDVLRAQRQELAQSLVDAESSAAAAELALSERRIEETIDKAKGVEAKINRQIAELRERGLESRRADSDPILAAQLNQSGRYISRDEYERQYRDLNQRLYDQRNQKTTPGATAGREASVGDMVALLKQLFPGAAIASTTGGKHVKGSDHYAGRAIDFVPKGGMGQYSTAEVEKMLEEAGVTIRRNAKGTKQIFGPGRSANKPGDHDNHFHFAWSGSASPEEAQRKAEQAAEQKRREEEKEARRVERYNRDLAGLQDAALGLQAKLADTADERYRLEREGLEISIAEQKRRIEASAEYTEAEKAKLLAALELKAGIERELLERRRAEELARQQLEIAQALLGNRRDILQAELRLADTRKERRAIELRLLDLSYEQEKAALDAVLASKQSTDAQKAIARARLDVLAQLKAGDRKALDREYESPIERYRRDIAGVGNNINDEMERIAVDGLDTLEDRLANVAFRAKSLAGVFKNVADQIIAELMRIAIRQAIIGPILGLVGGFFGGGGGGAGDAISNVLGGVKGGFKNAGMFAEGGLIPTGSFGIVGEAGPEPIFATAGGVGVLPNSALRSLSDGWAGPGGANVSIAIPIDATGADPAALGRVQASVDRLRAELPGQIVKTMQDAGDRRIVSTAKWR